MCIINFKNFSRLCNYFPVLFNTDLICKDLSLGFHHFFSYTCIRDFPRPILRAEYRPLPNPYELKLPKIVNSIPSSLAQQFGQKFMKIIPQIAKLQMFTITH